MKNLCKLIITSVAGFSLLLVASTSCSKFDDYKSFVKDGEVFYPGKPDTVITQSGYNRIALALVITDPNVKTYVIRWNSGADSLVANVERSGSPSDTVRTSIDQLEEETYVFQIYTFDAEGHRSIMTEVSGTAYGDNYATALLNRPLKTAYSQGGSTYLEWYEGESSEVFTEIEYRDVHDNLQTRRTLPAEMQTEIQDFQKGTAFRLRTHYLPDSTAVDTLAAPWEEIPAPEIVYLTLDKTKFAPFVLPTDIGSGYGWLMQYMWDGSVAEGSGFHTLDGEKPYHFTFDMGVAAELDELRIWMRRDVYYYGFGTPRLWEVWGSSNPAADGSFEGWTKLMTCESYKPSGLPVGNYSYTEADVAYANQGEAFKFPAGTPRVRYLRFKILDNWSSQTSSHIMEIDLKGDF